MNLIKDLNEIEATPRGNARLDKIAELDSPELRQILIYANDPSITFGMKQVPEILSSVGFVHNSEGWYKGLVPLLEELRNRRLTGHAAHEAVMGFLLDCDEDEQRWTTRIIRQDLRLDVGSKDINKALGEEVIYLFAVPLATDVFKIKPKDLKGRWILQPKLDGGRAVAILPANGGEVTMVSRTGKIWGNFGPVQAKLQAYNDTRKGPTLYLDGEVVTFVDGKIDFQAMQKMFHAEDDRQVGQMAYFIFDAAEENEWKNPKLSYSERLGMATEIALELNDEKDGWLIRPVPSDMVVDPNNDQIVDACKRFVERGFEGLMLRDADGPVLNKRSKKLLKAKMFSDLEAEIIGSVEGNGKISGMLGTLVCKTDKGVEFEVGSGFSEAMRAELWAKRDSLVGQFTTVKYFELSRDFVPRLPIFRAIRHPKDF